MIKTVPPGKSVQSFQFVAAVSADPKTNPVPTVNNTHIDSSPFLFPTFSHLYVHPLCPSQLTFFKTKAISFPGGDKFQPLGDCEIDPRADGCDAEDE